VIQAEPIVTERLTLEPVSPAAAAAVIAGDLSQIEVGNGWPHEHALHGLQHVAEGALVWFVTLKGQVIGDCGLHGAPNPQGEVEIGYGLAEPSRGLGYASEFVPALAGWLLRQPDVSRVVANTDADNIASRRALERAGFKVERERDGAVDYQLTR
jgi:RimJ/RimL family protein N-acetyltransferase